MDFLKEIMPAVTVCDKDGKIVFMNESSEKVNGEGLIGVNILEQCHPEPARTKTYRTDGKPCDERLYYPKRRGEETDLSDTVVP